MIIIIIMIIIYRGIKGDPLRIIKKFILSVENIIRKLMNIFVSQHQFYQNFTRVSIAERQWKAF